MQVRQARSDFESLLQDPQQPDAQQELANVVALGQTLQTQFTQFQSDLQTFGSELSDLAHIAPHGQATDQPVKNWFWRDIGTSRRTAALFVNWLTLRGTARHPRNSRWPSEQSHVMPLMPSVVPT